MVTMAIQQRPATEEDRLFMQQLYRTSRDFEMVYLSHLSAEQKEQFLDMQFEAQYQGYQQQCPNAVWTILEEDGVPIGRLIVDYRPGEIGAMDVCLLPEMRGRGIGTQIMRDLQQEGQQRGLPVRLYVTILNENARRLYERLGFEVIDQTPVHLHMEWGPGDGC